MTIHEYRKTKSVSLPVNGNGETLPQLIDELWEARENIINIRHKKGGTPEALAELAIGGLNRALNQLGIEL